MSPNRATYEPIPRSSTELSDAGAGADADEAQQFKDSKKSFLSSHSLSRKLRRLFRLRRLLYILLPFIVFISWQLLFNGSYMSLPAFEINKDERIYIAANIVDGDLISGDWGRGLKGLVELIGQERVFVSIYGGPKEALDGLAKELNCEKSIVAEEDEPLDMASLPRIRLATGEEKVKRIAYLAEVRNRALEPLWRGTKGEGNWDRVLFLNDVIFEPMDAARLLWGTKTDEEGKSTYKAVCAADFVTSWKYYDTFATRDTEGYSIGVPIFPWFANEGSATSRKDVLAGKGAVRVKSCWGGMVAFDGRYFRNETSGEGKNSTGSDRKNSAGKEMKEANGLQLPLRFRSEPEPFWDASECCLIHADLIASSPFHSTEENDPEDEGVYLNPFVRVAYDRKTHSWIGVAKRYERLFTFWQGVINYFAKLPVYNVRREEIEGEVVKDRRWVSWGVVASSSGSDSDEGGVPVEIGSEEGTWQGSGVSIKGKRDKIGKGLGLEYWESEGFYEDYERVAGKGGYCGARQLAVVKEDRKEGEGNWDNLLDAVPPVEPSTR